MILLRTVLGWTAAVLVALFLVANILVVPWFAPPRKWDRWAKFLCRRLVSCFFVRVEVVGRENFPADGSLLVGNHVNLLDLFLYYGWLPGYFRGLEQRQHFSWPIWGWAARRIGNLSLDQESGASAAATLLLAGKALAEGVSLLVFPEGHRTRTGQLRPFYRGAFRLAKTCQVPLVPVVQQGSWEAFGQGKGRAVGGVVRLTLLPAWTPERAAGLSDRELMAAVEAEFQRVLTPS